MSHGWNRLNSPYAVSLAIVRLSSVPSRPLPKLTLYTLVSGPTKQLRHPTHTGSSHKCDMSSCDAITPSTGFGTTTTPIAKLLVAVLPAVSCAVHITVVVPSSNMEPGSGVQVASTTPSMSSKAPGTPYHMATSSGDTSFEKSSICSITGGVVSPCTTGSTGAGSVGSGTLSVSLSLLFDLPPR